MAVVKAEKFPRFRFRLPRLPIAIAFTTEGLLYVLLSLAIGGAAVNTGNNVLYLIFSVMLALIVVSGIISRRNLSRLVPRVEFPEHVFAGAPTVSFLSVENRSRLFPSVGIRLVVRDSRFPYLSRYFFFIRRKGRETGLAQVVFPRRGEYLLKELELQTKLPFSFFVKIHRHFPGRKVSVYPRVYRFGDQIAARLVEGFQEDSPYRGDSQQLLHLRDYNTLDASKRIHWKASAKVEKLLVKEFQKEEMLDFCLYFDCYASRADQEEPMERAISLLASLSLMLYDKGASLRIVFPDRVFVIAPDGNDLRDLFLYLSAVGERPEPRPALYRGHEEIPALRLGSRRVPSVLPLPGNLATLLVEDWEHLMVEQLEGVKL